MRAAPIVASIAATFLAATFLVITTAAPRVANAQTDYPIRPVSLIVPYAAGGVASEAEGQLDYRVNHVGQCAGLIDAILPAGDVVRQIVAQAEDILRKTLPAMVTADPIRA